MDALKRYLKSGSNLTNTLILIVILLALPISVKMIQQKQGLFIKASDAITFTGSSVSQRTINGQSTTITKSSSVGIKLSSPYGPSSSSNSTANVNFSSSVADISIIPKIYAQQDCGYGSDGNCYCNDSNGNPLNTIQDVSLCGGSTNSGSNGGSCTADQVSSCWTSLNSDCTCPPFSSGSNGSSGSCESNGQVTCPDGTCAGNIESCPGGGNTVTTSGSAQVCTPNQYSRTCTGFAACQYYAQQCSADGSSWGSTWTETNCSLAPSDCNTSTSGQTGTVNTNTAPCGGNQYTYDSYSNIVCINPYDGSYYCDNGNTYGQYACSSGPSQGTTTCADGLSVGQYHRVCTNASACTYQVWQCQSDGTETYLKDETNCSAASQFNDPSLSSCSGSDSSVINAGSTNVPILGGACSKPSSGGLPDQTDQNKNGCCSSNNGCYNGQSCNVCNGACTSGMSCNPNTGNNGTNQSSVTKLPNGQGCCSVGSDCPNGQSCSISNGACQSGLSCNPNSGTVASVSPSPSGSINTCKGQMTCAALKAALKGARHDVSNFSCSEADVTAYNNAACPVQGTKSYRLAESSSALSSAPTQAYVSDSSNTIIVNHTFSDNSPGQKFIFVQFQDAQGNWSTPVSASILLVGPDPVISGTACPADVTGNGVSFTIQGTNLGTSNGTLTANGQNVSNITSWTDSSITAVLPNVVSNANGTVFNLNLTRADGSTSTGSCTVGLSTLKTSALYACSNPKYQKTVSNVQLITYDPTTQKEQKDTVTIDPQGDIKGIKAALNTKDSNGQPKTYKIGVKTPQSLLKVFTVPVSAGTTILTQPLPFGDITQQGKVDAVDVAAMYKQWSLTPKSGTNLTADANGDGVVNSIDYACLLLNYGKCDDPDPATGAAPCK